MAVQYVEETLSNGLKIVGEIDPSSASAAAGFFVRSGARDEPRELMGISHFLEHLVFKGNDDRSGEEIDEAFDELGVSHNAWTSHEITAFHVHGLPDVLEPALSVLASILRPALRESDIDDEREVVIEEIAMYEDQPFWQLWERAAEEYFGDHPMGFRVLGTTATVGSMSPEAIRCWHADRYGADNMVLALSGRIDFDRIVTAVDQLCGSWSRTGASRTLHELSHSEKEFVIQSDRVTAAYVMGIAPAPALQDVNRHAAAILNWVLGRGDGSRLYWSLVDVGDAEEARSEYEGHDRCGQTVSWAVCEPERIDYVESVMRAEHDAVADSLTEDDLAMARAVLRTAVTVHGELPAGRMQRLGRMQTTLGRYIPLEEELASLNAVTLEGVRRVAEAWPTQPVVMGRMVPQ